MQEKIGIQLEAYKRSTGDFGLPLAIRLRDKLSPGRDLKSNSFHFKLVKFIKGFWQYYTQMFAVFAMTISISPSCNGNLLFFILITNKGYIY